TLPRSPHGPPLARSPRAPLPRRRRAPRGSGTRDRTTPVSSAWPASERREDPVGEDPVQEREVEPRYAVLADVEVADLGPHAEAPAHLFDHEHFSLRPPHARAHPSPARAHVLGNRRLLLHLARRGIGAPEPQVQEDLEAVVPASLLLS